MLWWLRRFLGAMTGGLFWKVEDQFIIRHSRRLAREDLADPVIANHPALGDFLLRRQQGWYARELDWGGKPVRVTLKGGEKLRRQLDDAATFFAAKEMRSRILECAVAELPELVEAWQLPGTAAEGLGRVAHHDGLWFDGDGHFHAHFTHLHPEAFPYWISVWGTVADGPSGAMVEV